MHSKQQKKTSLNHNPPQDNPEQGSTIVEVLVTLLIIGIVLAAGLTAANNTTEGVQQSHERAEALKVTESQVEQLRGMSQADTDTITNSGGQLTFCITDNPDNRIVSFTETPPANYQDEDFSSYPPECITGPEDRYHVHVIYDPDDHYGTFYFHTRWERFSGSQASAEEVAIPYRRNFSTGPLVAADIPPSGPGSPPSASAECPPVFVGIEDSPDTENLISRFRSSQPRFSPPRWDHTFSFDLDTPLPSGCNYTATLTGIEYDHARYPVQLNQTQERFFIIGRTATGAITFLTPPTADIPECEGIENPGDEILPGEPGYDFCTQISNSFNVSIPSDVGDTRSISIVHLGQWNCSQYGYELLDGIDSNAACETLVSSARSNVNSIHGFTASLESAD